MGFYGGVVLGLQDIREEDQRQIENELQKANAERLQRADERAESLFNLNKRVTTAELAFTFAEKLGVLSGTKASPEDKQNLALLSSRVSGVEGADTWLAPYVDNPYLATIAMKEILEAEKKGEGRVQIKGEPLMGLLNVVGLENFQSAVNSYTTTGDITSAILGDEDEFNSLLQAAAESKVPPRPSVDVDPSLYERPNADFLKDQEKIYIAAVKQAAMLDLRSGNLDQVNFSDVNQAIKDTTADNIPPLLIKRYGQTAFNAMNGMSDPLYQGLENNILLQPYMQMWQMQ